MPELPEVEVVRAGLAPIVTGATVRSVTVADARSIRRFPGTPSAFAARLEGATILAAVRRGKFLWFPLGEASGTPTRGAHVPQAGGSVPQAGAAASPGTPPPAARGDALVMHLGMSGQALHLPAGSAAPRHERVRLVTERDGGTPQTILFNDQRIFGYLSIEELVPTDDGAPGGGVTWPGTSASDPAVPGPAPAWLTAVPAHAVHIARDPLDPAFRDEAFIASTRRTTSAIKRVLLDQSSISGIGNIYADESLWRSRIHPETPGRALSVVALRRLVDAVRETLREALAEGGTSFDEQYKNVNGVSGYFERRLQVYGRGGEPCYRCGGPVRRESFMNRSSHYCPRCQRRR